MAGQSASLPGGMHLSYDLSVGVIARIYLRSEVRAALRSCGRDGVLRWDPPAEVMMYSVNVLAHFRPVSARKVSHCLVDGLRWASRDGGLRVAGKSSIPRARARIAAVPFAALQERCVGQLADAGTRDA